MTATIKKEQWYALIVGRYPRVEILEASSCKDAKREAKARFGYQAASVHPSREALALLASEAPTGAWLKAGSR